MVSCTITKQSTVTISAELVERLEAIAIAKDTSFDLALETALLTYCEEIEEQVLGHAFSHMGADSLELLQEDSAA